MSWTILLPALCLLAWAAWRDVATRTIPNGVSLAIAILGLALRAAEGWPALLASLAVGIVLAVLLILLHARGALGGGDVKLLIALVIGLPPLDSWNLVIVTALVGGVLACLYLVLQYALDRSAALQSNGPRTPVHLASLARASCRRPPLRPNQRGPCSASRFPSRVYRQHPD